MILAVYSEPSDYQDVCGLEIDTTVDDSKRLALLGDAAKKVGKPARVHLHINTGMNRLGALPEEAVPLTKQILEGCQDGRFVFAGLKTHLSTADETDNDFCWQQERTFHHVVRDVLNICPQKFAPQVIHSQNTAWALRYQPWKDERYEEFNMHNWPRRMIRVGIGMYGFCALEVENTLKLLKPAVTIRSEIASLHYPPPGSPISYARKQYAPTKEEQEKSGKRFRIATIPQGYGEGVTKWDGQFVCIRGKKCPLVGKITMDFIMVDVTELGDEVQRGDSVLLFGKEERPNEECQGNNGMEVEIHLAGSAAGTSPHQFMARGGYRLNRVFLPIQK
jgi:alanine racemase